MITVEGKIVRGTYGLGDYLAAIDSAPCAVATNEAGRKAWHTGETNHEWHGLLGVAKDGESATNATTRLIRDGWQQGVDLMQQVAGAVDVPVPRSVRRRGAWMDQGDEVEMQRVWAGDLDRAWRRTVRLDSTGPRRVRILVDSIANGGVEANVMRWRGVAALRLCDVLVEAGYTVQVESVFCGKSDGHRYRLAVAVKDYSQPLDLPALAATTALPAFFRALHHEWHYLAAPGEIDGVSYYVLEATPEDFQNGDSAAVYLAGQKIKDARQAAAWVAECVRHIDGEEQLAA